MACLREHAEQLGRVGCALCYLQFCQHQMQPAQICLGRLPQSQQWTQQRLHCSHQILEVLHAYGISWWLSKASVFGQRL